MGIQVRIVVASGRMDGMGQDGASGMLEIFHSLIWMVGTYACM